MPSVNLVNFARPPQSLVYNDGGFIDGIKVDATLYLVYMTAYITYAVPSDAVASATLGAAPNPAENISCTVSSCVTSKSLPKFYLQVFGLRSIDDLDRSWCEIYADRRKRTYVFCQAIQPVLCNLSRSRWRHPTLRFFLEASHERQVRSLSVRDDESPLLTYLCSTAQAVANGNGQVSIVQVSDTSILLFQRSRSEILQVYVCTLDINNTNLVLADPAGALTNGILALKAATVMPSVIQAYTTRFGLKFPTGADYNLIYDTWVRKST